jgi:hypothetical protein
MNVPTLTSDFWSEITLPKVLCVRMHFYDAQSTSPAKDLVVSNLGVPVNISKLEDGKLS